MRRPIVDKTYKISGRKIKYIRLRYFNFSRYIYFISALNAIIIKRVLKNKVLLNYKKYTTDKIIHFVSGFLHLNSRKL